MGAARLLMYGVSRAFVSPAMQIKAGSTMVIDLAYSTEYVSALCPGTTAVSCNAQGWCTGMPKFVPTARMA
jgi:hypothetical protein